MKRVMIASVLGLGLAAGAAFAQTPAPAARPAAPAAPRPGAAQAPSTPAAPAAPVAQTPAPAPAPVPFPADAKIGVVSMPAIISQSKFGKAGQDRLKELSDKKNTEMAAQNKLVQTLQQEIASGQGVLSQAVLAQKNADLERLTRETQFKQEQAQADIEALNDQLIQEFQVKVLPIIEEVRAERGLWLILSAGDTGLAAVNAGLDLSMEIVKRLDAATK